jgi:hypothetical protein
MWLAFDRVEALLPEALAEFDRLWIGDPLCPSPDTTCTDRLTTVRYVFDTDTMTVKDLAEATVSLVNDLSLAYHCLRQPRYTGDPKLYAHQEAYHLHIFLWMHVIPVVYPGETFEGVRA